MTNRRKFNFTLFASISLVAMGSSANESRLKQSHDIEKKITQDAAASQKKINASSDAAMQLSVDIEQLQAEAKGLEIYRDHLKGMVASQERELESFNTQLGEIEQTRMSIVPLMYSMLEGLSAHIEADRPIRIEARRDRLARLNEMMLQANISDAEKYRRILEAFQIEMDYGTKLGSYSDSIEVDGHKLIAEQLYLGRISLVARSGDRQNYWSWDAQTNRWQPLSLSSSLDIDKAFDIANKQAAPALLNLPVSVKSTNTVEEVK